MTKIGANTQTHDDGSSFYPIQIVVRDKSFDLKKDTQAEFIPGMEATVELIGEKRTIAAYLMKPMDKMRGEFSREIGWSRHFEGWLTGLAISESFCDELEIAQNTAKSSLFATDDFLKQNALEYPWKNFFKNFN